VTDLGPATCADLYRIAGLMDRQSRPEDDDLYHPHLRLARWLCPLDRARSECPCPDEAPIIREVPDAH